MGAENRHQTVTDVKGKKIAQIGIVVGDAAKMAKRYSEILGIGPWIFLDVIPTEIIMHNKPLGDEEASIRIALANLGKMQIELIQPLYGPSTHMEFLNEKGEGIHHISFGRVDDHDEIVSALMGQGIEIEMQGLLGDAFTFTYMATKEKLGAIFEAVRPAPPGVRSTIQAWGNYESQGLGVVNLEGKEIVQLGIVVKDAEKTAKRYWEIFGMGPWLLFDFKPPHMTDGIFHGITMGEMDFHVKAAIAQHENIQFELLEPVYGPSTHMEFLKTHGAGIHHVSFGAIDDHDRVVSALGDLGIGVEMKGLLGGTTTFTYMDTRKDLGTIFEMVKTNPDAKSTITPYGSYPPSK